MAEPVVTHGKESKPIGVDFSADLLSGETLTGTVTLIVFDDAEADVSDQFFDAPASISGGDTVVRTKVAADGSHDQPTGIYRIEATAVTSTARTLVTLGKEREYPVLIVVDGFGAP